MSAHWGLPYPASTLCGVVGNRWTTLRGVNCQWCLNIIDRFLCENHDGLMAAGGPKADPPTGDAPSLGGKR